MITAEFWAVELICWIRLVIFTYKWLCAVCAQSLQLCLTFCDPVDHSLPGSSLRRILQVWILEWVAMPSFRDLPSPGIEPAFLALAGGFSTTSTTWEAQMIIEPENVGNEKKCICWINVRNRRVLRDNVLSRWH